MNIKKAKEDIKNTVRAYLKKNVTDSTVFPLSASVPCY